MSKYEFLKPFIFDIRNRPTHIRPYEIYRLGEQDIVVAEKRLGFVFPQELRKFYLDIGWGFINCDDEGNINRLMNPDSVADFRLRENIHATDPVAEDYTKPNELVFFEVNECNYLVLKLDEITEDGKCPIYFVDTKIANSLDEFIFRMKEDPAYFDKM
jgi:hypothetical protein